MGRFLGVGGISGRRVLAPAESLGATLLTCDRAWARGGVIDYEIKLIE